MKYHIEYAIRDVKNFIPSFIPEDDQTYKTQVFNLGYGKLKLTRMTENLVWCGFVLPGKHYPELKNLLHLTPMELTIKAHSELMTCDNCGKEVKYYDINQDNSDNPMYLCWECWVNPKV
jgi:hypothetical protein